MRVRLSYRRLLVVAVTMVAIVSLWLTYNQQWSIAVTLSLSCLGGLPVVLLYSPFAGGTRMGLSAAIVLVGLSLMLYDLGVGVEVVYYLLGVAILGIEAAACSGPDGRRPTDSSADRPDADQPAGGP